ncbi:MAG TPA: hypothetical protein VK662_01045 [Acidothermaceae bacterium]|nr:hypothetical protein [Acidothermaceae bacterium]
MKPAWVIVAAPLIVLAACAAPVTGSASVSSQVQVLTSPTAESSSAGPWGAQDGTPAAARAIACGPKPYGADAGLARELADLHRYDNTPYPGPPTAQPPPLSASPSPPPVPGQLQIEDLTLVPPPATTKPAACADVALRALQAQPDTIGDAQPAKVWLAILSAPTPASINADGSATPYFTNVLAWVFYFDELPPLCPAGGPVGPGQSQVECNTATMGPSSALLSVDAMTAEPLTNEYSGGPLLP